VKILKSLREARGLSQEKLAKSLGVLVSQVEAWESGAEEPSSIHLRDLAIILGCGAEDLIRAYDEDNGPISTNTYYVLTSREEEDGFWGHFGVLLYGHLKSKWYPITLATANYVSSVLKNVEHENEWMMVETLNNRILLINPASVSRLWLLDDAQDEPGKDWDISLDGYQGQPSEFYKAIEELCYAEDTSGCSDIFIKFYEDFTSANDMGDEELASFVFDTHIHDRNGVRTSYRVSATNLAEIVDDFSFGGCPVIFDLSCDSFDSYFPSRSISLLDMPRRQIDEARKELSEQDETN